MEKHIIKKIIKGVIIFAFVLFFVQAIFPTKTHAAIKLDWDNPNKTGSSPYKFKTSDVLNSQMIMQVVGCTGVTDKVSTAIVNFSKDLLTAAGRREVKTKVCSIAKKLGVVSTSSVPNVSTVEIPKLINCSEIQQTEDKTTNEYNKKIADQEAATKKREECLNGIAITLARNQLTSMTRDTMNWINTGFEGNPMYVRNINSFTNSLEKNVIETGVNILTTPNKAYPYGSDFSRSAILGYNSGSSLRTGATNFLDSLTSDLSNFVTDPNSYYSNDALEKANSANNTFSNDFSSGGWDGWLALTQKDQNNPLGFTMKASEFLQDQQMNQTQNAKDELATNDGFLSQKKCVKWTVINPDGTTKMKEVPLGTPKAETTTRPDDNDVCAPDGYETITPGSIIKDKVSTYINSPERQLELTDTINESLNALFTSLISKFVNEGLSSITSSTDTNFTSTDNQGGYGNNNLEGNDSISLESLGLDTNLSSGSGGYSDGSFDLTRDLGNTYIHNYTDKSRLGSWSAGTNKTVLPVSSLADRNIESNLKLTQGIAPIGKDGTPLVNVYYDVIAPGLTIIADGVNKWEAGDRAFWDGEKWQNWKCGRKSVGGKIVCTNQINPLKKKGVLQLQKDYITAAKQYLSVLPTIMPKLGELDYCIPGPNPNWQTNSGEAEGAFTELAGTMTEKPIYEWRCKGGTSPVPFVFSSRHYVALSCFNNTFAFILSDNERRNVGYSYTTADPGTKEYDNYFSIFENTLEEFWNLITEGTYWTSFNDRYYKTGRTAQEIIDLAVSQATTDIALFYKQYGDYINRTYGANSPMQRQYLENEKTSTLVDNPAYLPMSSGGLDITKDIVSYDEDIDATTDEYKNNIIKANENINKLETIRKEVAQIISAAQKRRDDKLMAEKGLTYDQYVKKYAACLNEEDIIYYDDFEVKNATDEATRCSDGMDNDLDGLVDNKDSDCSGGPNNTNGTCVNGEDSHSIFPMSTPSCSSRKSRIECILAPYYHANVKTSCEWNQN